MRSIGNYLKSRLLIGSAVIVAGGSVTLAFAMRTLDLREFDAALETKARTLSTFIFMHANGIEVDFADEYLPEFERENGREYFQVQWMDGTVIEGSKDLAELPFPFFPATDGTSLFKNVTLPDGRPGRLVRMVVVPRVDSRAVDEDETDLFPLPAGIDTAHPYVVLTVAWGRQQLDAVLWTIYATILGMMLLLMVLLSLLVRRSMKLGFKPIKEMNKQLRDLGPNFLDRRIVLGDPPAELEPALTALNGFLDDLQKAFARERRFTSNVAHELRTPVAEFRLACEIGAKWPDDPELVRQRFEELRESSLRMERKVKGLLELSRLESSVVAVDAADITLHHFLESQWQQARDVCNPRRLVFANRIPESLVVRSDKVKLDMIVQNLFFNALSYSSFESVVTAEGQMDHDGRFLLSISNRTEHLEEGDVDRLFDRFWRKNHGEADGNCLGLGLSIVHSLAELLNLRVGVELTRDRMFVFHLTFPSAAVIFHARENTIH